MVSAETVNNILNDLEFKFIDCKFIFPSLPIPDEPLCNNSAQNSPARRKRSNFVLRLIKKTKEALKEIQGDANSFENCTYSPGTEDGVKQQMNVYQNRNAGHIRYTFINCRFIQRESGLLENLASKVKRLIGITFSLVYWNGSVEVVEYKLKLKHIPEWTQLVIQQISEDE